MPGLVPGIHVFYPRKQDVDGRVKPGHDELIGAFLSDLPRRGHRSFTIPH
jgi:hypothetical protein